MREQSSSAGKLTTLVHILGHHWLLLKRFLRKEIVTQSRYHSSSARMSSRVAVCQMTAVADKAANLKVVSKLVSDAAKEDVKMIFFPEACDYIADNKKDVVGLSESIIGGTIVKRYRELAAEHGVWLSMGGVHERDSNDATKMYNTHIIINSAGDIVQTYRKLHLFDVEIPEKNVRLKESDYSNPGGHIVTPVDSPIGKIGMAICYDMRFPELSCALSIMGASVLTYPSAFTQTTGEAHWHVLLRARAIENQCYVIAAAQSGSHNAKRKSFGHAVVIDPWGNILTDCGTKSPSYGVVHICPKKLEDVRTNMPVFRHKRRDVYSLYSLSLRKDILPLHSDSPAVPAQQTEQVISKQTDVQTNVFGHVRVPETCVFFKSELTYAFVNLRCVIPGHVLIAPIRLVERNKDLTQKEADDFFRTIVLVQRLMEKVHSAESCTVTIQDGPDAGRTVNHLHCHIMPRKKGDFIENDLIYLELAKHDQFKSGHPSKPARSIEEMESEAKFLREQIKLLLKQS